MHCGWTRERLTALASGDLHGLAKLFVLTHLRACPACFEKYESRERESSPLTQAPPARFPLDLRTRIRIAISIERAHGTPLRRLMTRWGMLLRDVARPFAVRVVGGATVAILLFTALVPDLWSGRRVLASDDIPVTYFAKGLVSSPAMGVPGPYVRGSEAAVVIAYVDLRGNVYHIEPLADDFVWEPKVRAEIANALLFTQFEPATKFGRPVLGRVLISFSSCTVIG